jgi:hypothetical protein
MPTSMEMNEIVARLETLEQQNRRWRRGGAVMLLAAAALVLMAQAKPGGAPKVAQAQAFELVDPTGKVVATLDGRDGPSLVKFGITDGAGKEKFTLVSSENGSMVRLTGAADRTASLLVGSNGPAVLLEEPARQGQAMLAISQKGAVLSLTDQGQLGAALVTGPQARGVALYDSNGKPVWSMPQ